jgi:glycosyltransferase involved in cell wall biosynthesis
MPDRITVLQVIPRMRAGGAERGCLQIAEALVAAGHRAIVVSEGGQLVPELISTGAEHVTMPVAAKSPIAMLLNARRLARTIRSEAVDIIHARSRAPAWSALIAARRTGIGFVTTYHSEYSERGRLKNLYNSVMARSDTVIAVSDYMAHLIRTRYATPEERISIIHRAFDETVFDPHAVTSDRIVTMRSALSANGDRPVLLLAGRITPRKAQHHLVEALGLIRRDGGPECICVLAGEIEKASFRTELETQASRLGVAEWLRFPGHVRDMAAAYAISDVSLNISEQEGLPRVAIEAQAMGVPMIVSDTGPGREVALTSPDVPDEQASGLRVPYAAPDALAAAIQKLLAIPAAERQAMGARGADHVRRRFTLEQLKSKTLTVYDTVLARRRGHVPR